MLITPHHAPKKCTGGVPTKRTIADGFTIVELLIVIVVIAILAAISIVAYTGIQARARDSQRQQDMSTITKALEMYYIDNGVFPSSAGGSTTINGGWSTTTDDSWEFLANQLVPKYLPKMPTDPVSTKGINMNSSAAEGYGYAYFRVSSSYNLYCGAKVNEAYLLVYRNETGKVSNTTTGDCPTNPIGYYSPTVNSNIRVVK